MNFKKSEQSTQGFLSGPSWKMSERHLLGKIKCWLGRQWYFRFTFGFIVDLQIICSVEIIFQGCKLAWRKKLEKPTKKECESGLQASKMKV